MKHAGGVAQHPNERVDENMTHYDVIQFSVFPRSKWTEDEINGIFLLAAEFHNCYHHHRGRVGNKDTHTGALRLISLL